MIASRNTSDKILSNGQRKLDLYLAASLLIADSLNRLLELLRSVIIGVKLPHCPLNQKREPPWDIVGLLKDRKLAELSQ